MRLLIVDDEESTCAGMKARIEDMRFAELNRIDIAFSAEDAAAQALTGPVDLLLTDIRMVDMDGFELIDEIQRIHPNVCCIIMTAYANFEYAHRAIKLGTKDFLLKPFSHEELFSAIDGCIRQARENRENEEELVEGDAVGWAREYIQKHMRENINMAVVANELNLSYSYFSRLFKQSTGKSFTTYITEEKIKRAAELIARGYRTQQVARRVGYLNASTFSRAFENYWGCTPSMYKKQGQGNHGKGE